MKKLSSDFFLTHTALVSGSSQSIRSNIGALEVGWESFSTCLCLCTSKSIHNQKLTAGDNKDCNHLLPQQTRVERERISPSPDSGMGL